MGTEETYIGFQYAYGLYFVQHFVLAVREHDRSPSHMSVTFRSSKLEDPGKKIEYNIIFSTIVRSQPLSHVHTLQIQVITAAEP